MKRTFFIILEYILTSIPLNGPDAKILFYFQIVGNILRMYFLIVIPLDLAFNNGILF